MSRTLLTAATLATLAACQSGPTGPAAPTTFTVRGNVSIVAGYPSGLVGRTCDTSQRPGATDMAPGAQVVVYDNAGKSLAVGMLTEGTILAGGICLMPFVVFGVPEGAGPVAVEVTHRGKVAFTRAEASDVEMSLRLTG